MNREFCKEIKGGWGMFTPPKIPAISWQMKVILFFVKEHRHESEGCVLVFKIFRGKMYVLDQFRIPPKHFNCRHTVNFLSNE